jgi:hypothetical protein
MHERAGAPDPHTEIASVVMLAATNANVDRLNGAAQAVRAAGLELGPAHDYRLTAGRELRLHAGDHVLIRLNDRNQRMHQGPDVLNGYRGLVEHIDDDRRVTVAWRATGPDGPQLQRAVLDPGFVAAGGLSLGYAMTVHKAEGLTVGAGWTRDDSAPGGGVVLVHAAGMDAAALHVATTRHREQVLIFTVREPDHHEHAHDITAVDRPNPALLALAEHARTGARNLDDIPVHDDLHPTRDRDTAQPEPAQPATEPEPAVVDVQMLEPTPEPALDDLAARLKDAWTEQADAARQLARTQTQLAAARAHLDRREEDAQRLAASAQRLDTARAEADTLQTRARVAAERIADRTTELREQIHRAWAREYTGARAAAADYLAGPGRLGFGQGRMNRAEDTLQQWAGQWRHLHLALDTTDTARLAGQAHMHPANHQHTVNRAFEARVAEQVRTELPGEHHTLAAAKTTVERVEELTREHQQFQSAARVRPLTPPGLGALGRDPARAVDNAEAAHQWALGRHELATTRVAELRAHPALEATPEPDGWLQTVAGEWSQARTAAQIAARAVRRIARAAERTVEHDHAPHWVHRHDLHRDGPGLGL